MAEEFQKARTQIVDAVYEHGVFRPTGGKDLGLSEGEPVRIVVEALEQAGNESEPDPAVEREMQAYHALHPTLQKDYFDKYVAIYHGKLVDHDDDPAALLARIEAKYPDEFVWTTRVGPEPLRTFVIRSPRIQRNDAS